MKLIIAAALVLPIGAAAEAPPAKPEALAPLNPTRADMPNLLGVGRSGCPSIAHQIAEANRSHEERADEARTLDREPAAHLLLAVDRHIDGCRQVTFVRRNVAPGSAMPNPRSEPSR